MLFGVFLAILVERKTPLTSTKGTERQKNKNNKCFSSEKRWHYYKNGYRIKYFVGSKSSVLKVLNYMEFCPSPTP